MTCIRCKCICECACGCVCLWVWAFLFCKILAWTENPRNMMKALPSKPCVFSSVWGRVQPTVFYPPPMVSCPSIKLESYNRLFCCLKNKTSLSLLTLWPIIQRISGTHSVFINLPRLKCKSQLNWSTSLSKYVLCDTKSRGTVSPPELPWKQTTDGTTSESTTGPR